MRFVRQQPIIQPLQTEAKQVTKKPSEIAAEGGITQASPVESAMKAKLGIIEHKAVEGPQGVSEAPTRALNGVNMTVRTTSPAIDSEIGNMQNIIGNNATHAALHPQKHETPPSVERSDYFPSRVFPTKG